MCVMVELEKPVSVAQHQNSTKIFSRNEKNSLYYNDKDFTILLPYGEKKEKKARAVVLEFFSRYEKIICIPATVAVYKQFLVTGASYAKELSSNTDTPISTVYRAIDQLRDSELIIPLTKLQVRKSHGARPTLWGLADSTEEEQNRAAQRYIKSKRKTYKLVQELVQRTLPEIQNEMVQFRKICFLARNMDSRGFHFLDLAEQAALELKDQGIKVLQ